MRAGLRRVAWEGEIYKLEILMLGVKGGVSEENLSSYAVRKKDIMIGTYCWMEDLSTLDCAKLGRRETSVRTIGSTKARKTCKSFGRRI